MPAFLVPVDPDQCLIPLDKAVVLIGRQADCDVSLTKSRKISRKHCCIAQVNNTVVVRDLGSTNGVFLNGNRIEKEVRISIGDELIIGDVQFRVENEAPAATIKKKSKSRSGVNKSAKEVVIEPTAASKSARGRSSGVAANLDSPIAIPEGNVDFELETTSIGKKKSSPKPRVEDVVPTKNNEDETIGINDEFRLAPDNF